MCDIMEPMRPIIDYEIRKAINLNQCKKDDFEVYDNRWCLSYQNSVAYIQHCLFMEEKMIVVSYDISDDKLRTKFSKYLSRFGHRLQYSVFEIDNSPRIVDNIVNDLKNRYEKLFSQQDSVIIFKLSSSCEVLRFGYAKNDEKDFIIIS